MYVYIKDKQKKKKFVKNSWSQWFYISVVINAWAMTRKNSLFVLILVEFSIQKHDCEAPKESSTVYAL